MRRIVVVTKSAREHQALVFLVRTLVKKSDLVQAEFLHLPTQQQLRTLKDRKGDSIFLIVPEDVRCGSRRVAEELLASMANDIEVAYVEQTALGQTFQVSDQIVVYSLRLPEEMKKRLSAFAMREEIRQSGVRNTIPSAPDLAAAG